MEKPFLKVNATFPPWGKEEVQLSLTVTALPVGNNSMPPIASLCLGTSGCDYPGRIEFGKKQDQKTFEHIRQKAASCDIIRLF